MNGDGYTQRNISMISICFIFACFERVGGGCTSDSPTHNKHISIYPFISFSLTHSFVRPQSLCKAALIFMQFYNSNLWREEQKSDQKFYFLFDSYRLINYQLSINRLSFLQSKFQVIIKFVFNLLRFKTPTGVKERPRKNRELNAKWFCWVIR